MLGAYAHNSWIAIFAATGVILSAAYALYLYRRVIFGALVKPTLQTIQDLSAREIAILAPLVVITIALGVYPKPVFDVTTPSVAKLIADNKTSLAFDHAGHGALARANNNFTFVQAAHAAAEKGTAQ
jgi:NADH-quinone oxidoreductase subunit M